MKTFILFIFYTFQTLKIFKQNCTKQNKNPYINNSLLQAFNWDYPLTSGTTRVVGNTFYLWAIESISLISTPNDI